MSTRWYPLFQPGNPQLRVFLPNFWMKLIRERGRNGLSEPRLSNRAQFIVSMEMTKHDVKNYLNKIYNVDTIAVNTQVRSGETREVPTTSGKMVVKDDDYKVAFVTLAEGATFEFPDIYPKDKIEGTQAEEQKQLEQSRLHQKKNKGSEKTKPDLPGWFL